MGLLPSNQRDQVMVIVALFAFGAAGIYFQYVWSPKNEQLTAIEQHVENLDANNQKAKAELAKGSVNELREQALRYQRNLAIMRQLVPTSNEVPALLEQVSTAARRVGLEISGVQPAERVMGEQFDTYRYNIAILADYHALGQFLTNVGSLPRIVAPTNLRVTLPVNSARKSKVKDEALLEAHFDIQTYVARTGPGTESADGDSRP
jgi:type IV pilus assembly protein PilO